MEGLAVVGGKKKVLYQPQAPNWGRSIILSVSFDRPISAWPPKWLPEAYSEAYSEAYWVHVFLSSSFRFLPISSSINSTFSV